MLIRLFLRGSRHLFSVLSVLCLGVGCASSDPASARTETRVTSQLGATCGEWQTSAPNAVPSVRVNVQCGAGLSCYGTLYVYPEDGLGNRFGQCLPTGGLKCEENGTCANPALTCLIGDGAPYPGTCFFRCAKHQDCPGPFQICSTDGCQFNTCTAPGVTPPITCTRGAHCEDSLCVPDAGTQ